MNDLDDRLADVRAHLAALEEDRRRMRIMLTIFGIVASAATAIIVWLLA